MNAGTLQIKQRTYAFDCDILPQDVCRGENYEIRLALHCPYVKIWLKVLAVFCCTFRTAGYVWFSLLLTRIAITHFGPSFTRIRANLLLGIVLADSIENICLLLLLILYPEWNLAIDVIAGTATFIKQSITEIVRVLL
jgi:hypothetical protein